MQGALKGEKEERGGNAFALRHCRSCQFAAISAQGKYSLLYSRVFPLGLCLLDRIAGSPPRDGVCAHPECLRTGSFRNQARRFLPSHGRSSVSSLRTLWRVVLVLFKRAFPLRGKGREGENESCAWFPGVGGAFLEGKSAHCTGQ